MNTGVVPSVGAVKLHKFMADFSYSLYVFHLPIVFFVYFVIFDETSYNEFLPIGTVVFCMLLAWFVSIFTEKKRIVLRAWLMRLVKTNVHEKLG